MNWKYIPSLNGFYLAGDDGHIYRRNATRPLTEYLNNTGRKRVSLSIHGVRYNGSVARLVCEAFHGPCPDGMECAHNDGNRTNNHPDNLAWKTPEENYADRDRHGTTAYGERNGQAKLSESHVSYIRERLSAGESQSSIARSLGISQTTISLIALGKRRINRTPTPRTNIDGGELGVRTPSKRPFQPILSP